MRHIGDKLTSHTVELAGVGNIMKYRQSPFNIVLFSLEGYYIDAVYIFLVGENVVFGTKLNTVRRT